jgi:sterol desaturase/sphingolipid hydroxylase (fatty acid hydroxylase superfamily)
VEWLAETYAPVPLALGGVLAHYAVYSFLERLWPAEPGQRIAGTLPNIGVTAVYYFVTPLANFFPAALAAKVADSSFVRFDLPGGIVSLLVPLLIFDFFYYWFHRLQHRVPALWRYHRLHHSDTAVNVTTSVRHHWLEQPFRTLLIAIPMNLLVKLTPAESGLLAIFIAQWVYLIHANLRLPLGPATWVVVGPVSHRIHHSRLSEHSGVNYATFFPVWDIVFRTFHAPRSNEIAPTGTDGAPPLARDLLL